MTLKMSQNTSDTNGTYINPREGLRVRRRIPGLILTSQYILLQNALVPQTRPLHNAAEEWNLNNFHDSEVKWSKCVLKTE